MRSVGAFATRAWRAFGEGDALARWHRDPSIGDADRVASPTSAAFTTLPALASVAAIACCQSRTRIAGSNTAVPSLASDSPAFSVTAITTATTHASLNHHRVKGQRRFETDDADARATRVPAKPTQTATASGPASAATRARASGFASCAAAAAAALTRSTRTA